MKKWIYVFLAIWWISFGTLCGFHFSQWPNVQESILPFLEKHGQIFVPLFNASSIATSKVLSDSTGQYLLFISTLLLSLLLSTLFANIKINPKSALGSYSNPDFGLNRLSHMGRPILLCYAQYYLALFMLIYGVNKAFKWQFADPEPNLLYTQAGMLSKELLFWMSMGSSHLYNVVTGSVEILAGLLLLFRPRMLFTVILTFAVVAHIVLLNFSFDISVKLFSTFLWLLSSTLLFHHPHFGILFGYRYEMKMQDSVRQHPKKNYRWIKLCAVIGICIEAFGSIIQLQLQQSPLSGDEQTKPRLYGAYQVAYCDTMYAPTGLSSLPEKLFIHKNGYLIWMDAQTNTARHQVYMDETSLMCIDPDLPEQTKIWRYGLSSDTVYLSDSNRTIVKMVALPWREMPLLRDEMHLFMDSN